MGPVPFATECVGGAAATTLDGGAAIGAAGSEAPVPPGELGPPGGVGPTAEPPAPEKTSSHGFRVGYSYVNGLGPDSPLRSPHLFVIGYELTQRAVGGRWLDVIVVENASIAGINQSVFVPNANTLVGFRIDGRVEVGTGIQFAPLDPEGKVLHQVLAVGWTPPAGAFHVPLHLTFVPDIDGHWRLGSTVGVNW